ncbi:hypothetical protein B5X24_HaOG214359 [Helicoverpa armigera]|nr:hypothetical protein B5X24_HaOG214359 [Helicoverpa armigera]
MQSVRLEACFITGKGSENTMKKGPDFIRHTKLSIAYLMLLYVLQSSGGLSHLVAFAVSQTFIHFCPLSFGVFINLKTYMAIKDNT